MAYNKTNAAYDLSKFAPKEEIEEPEIEQPKEPRRRMRLIENKMPKPATVVKWVFVSLFVMLSLTSIMVGNIKLTQLNDQMTSVQKSLNDAKSDEVSLNAQLETRMSMSQVEEYATSKLGLVKVQPYQVQYIHLTNTDKVVVSSDKTGMPAVFANVIDFFKEYFG